VAASLEYKGVSVSSTDNPIVFLFNLIGSLVCHQLPERTLSVGGYYLPVCARCTGAYIGLLLGYLLLPMRRKRSSGPPNLLITLLMLAPLIIDAGTQWTGLRTSTNQVRLITGLLFGTGMAPFLVYTLSLIPTSNKIPVLKGLLPETAELDSRDPWLSNKALIIGLLTAVALYFAISSLAGSRNIMLYWSLSSLIIASVVWHIFMLPIALVILYAFSLRT
jgi:uncharacterized membrane protein